MSKEELEEALDIIVDSICKSKMNNYAKIELMMNLKKFFENYDKNIRTLRESEKIRK